MARGTLALIPARGGSKGILRKNLALLGGLSLLGHAIGFARTAEDVERIVVSTDDDKIAKIALELGADVPFRRPADLAADEAPTWLVLQHALRELAAEGHEYERLLLVQPTSPFRTADDVAAAHRLLEGEPTAEGVVGASRPGANPIWLAVTAEDEGWLEFAVPREERPLRRQQAGDVLIINGALYLWRTQFVLEHDDPNDARSLLLEMAQSSSIDIDDPWALDLAEAVLASGLVRLPWLAST